VRCSTRKLFEASIVNEIVSLSTKALDLQATVNETLQIVRRFVDYDLAAIALPKVKTLGVRLTRAVSRNDVEQFRAAAVGNMEQLTSTSIDPSEMAVWVDGDAEIEPNVDMGGMNSLFAMPLRSRGEVLGVLTVASSKPGVYAAQLVRTLRLVEYPISTVVDSAYHHQKLLEQEARLSLSALGER
jgi:transcriptional regulator with GAF, ATPase, and Fis domain